MNEQRERNLRDAKSTARPWVFSDNAMIWRQRNGARVPVWECLSPHDRVGVAAFAAAMVEMGAEDLDDGHLVA